MMHLIKNIDSQLKKMSALLESWVNISSRSDDLEGLERMKNALIQSFKSLGGEIELVSMPPRKQIDSEGNLVETPLGQSIIIRKYPLSAKKVFLSGHMDTALSASNTCKYLDSNRLQGIGAADMKGGLVIMLEALQTLENSSLAGKLGWTVCISSDEEIGSPGSAPLLTQLAKGHQLGMIFEPALPHGKIVSARKGSLNFTAIARGKPAHAGRDFHLGINALSKIARFALFADSLTNGEKETTVNLGKLEGGGPVNIVPHLGICRFNIRVKTKEEMTRIKSMLENGAKEHQIELFLDNQRVPKPFDQKTEALFGRFCNHAKRFGHTLEWQSTGGVCDGNTLAATGIPTIDTLGVIGGHLHTLEEFALIDSLTERAKWSAALLLEEAGWNPSN